MREKILAELRKRFSGLPTKLLELVATKLAGTVTEEDKIEAAIDGLANSPLSLQDFAGQLKSESDRRVTEARKKWEQEHGAGGNDPDDDNDDVDDNEGQQQQSGKRGRKGKTDKLLDAISALTQKVNALQEEKAQTSLSQKLSDTLKAKLEGKKPIPALFVGKYKLEKAEDAETLADTIINEYTALQQEMTNGQIRGATTPVNSSGGAGAKDIDQYFKSFAEKNRKQNPAASMNGATK